MNSIEAIQDKSDYEDAQDFLNYKIDGYWLDEQLEALYLENMYKGLVPTLLDWMERQDEQAMGLDRTKEWDPEKVGSTVDWFDKPTELNFSKKDYFAMLEAFKQGVTIPFPAVPPPENPSK